jgi:hypothetical protein
MMPDLLTFIYLLFFFIVIAVLFLLLAKLKRIGILNWNMAALYDYFLELLSPLEPTCINTVEGELIALSKRHFKTRDSHNPNDLHIKL